MSNKRTPQHPAVLAQGVPYPAHSVGGSETPQCVCQQATPGASAQGLCNILWRTGGAPDHLSQVSLDPISKNHRDPDQAPLGMASRAPKLLLTVEEAAQQLSIGRPKMWQLVMRGEVLSIKIGASRRIPVTAVQEYVQRLCDAVEAEVNERRNGYGH